MYNAPLVFIVRIDNYKVKTYYYIMESKNFIFL